MTYKKFIDNIENIYADQGDKPESERLRYGQIIMMELWHVWPQKYHQIAGSDKDPLLAPALYDLLDELEKEWPVFPDKTDAKNYSIPSPEQIRIQRLEKMTPEDIDDIKAILSEQLDILQRLGKIPLPLGSIPDDKYEEIMILYNSVIECNKIMKEIVDGPVGGIEKLVERTKLKIPPYPFED